MSSGDKRFVSVEIFLHPSQLILSCRNVRKSDIHIFFIFPPASDGEVSIHLQHKNSVRQKYCPTGKKFFMKN